MNPTIQGVRRELNPLYNCHRVACETDTLQTPSIGAGRKAPSVGRLPPPKSQSMNATFRMATAWVSVFINTSCQSARRIVLWSG